MTVETTAYSELVNSLREQLKLQQAINCQYEVDIEARDELVSMLQTRLKYYEDVIVQHCAELENRRVSIKSMGCTVVRLEKLCRQLEEELERSREESRASDVPVDDDHASSSQINNDHQNALVEQQIEELTQQLKSKEAEVDLLNQERQYAIDNTSRLEGLLRKRDAELEDARTRIIESEHEAGELRSQNSSAAREHDEQKRLYNELAQREAMTKSQLELAIKEKAERDVAIRTLQEQTTRLTNEIEQLRRQVHGLKQESADKEVKIVQLNKLHQQYQEDKAGLNIALDAKQQELQLIKRKLQVKGTGGSTPAHSRASTASESSSRRGSLGFTTPLAHPRPRSAIGMTHSTKTPDTKIDVGEDLSTVKPNKIGLPINGPSLNASTNFQHQLTPGLRSSTRHYLKNVNGTPSTSLGSASRPNHHRRSPSVTSTSSSIASGSEKENNRTKTSRVSVPA